MVMTHEKEWSTARFQNFLNLTKEREKMKKLMTAAFCLLAASLVYGEYRENPDQNTLWSEDGKEIKGWIKDGLTPESLPNGGFALDHSGKQPHGGGFYALASNDYPWLTFEITKVERHNGYRQLSFFGKGFTVVTDLQPGIYAFRMPETKTAPGKKEYFRVDVYGMKIFFRYMKAVKAPENSITAEVKDGKVTYKVNLKTPAEDVALYLFDGYGMRQLTSAEGNKIQLRPEDKTNPVVWVGESPVPEKTKGVLFVKASVLGSDTLKVPLWGKINKVK